jgi:hypothetical protein
MPRDDFIITVLRDRTGTPTEVELKDGQLLVVLNIAWGYDEGDEFAHVTTNISPSDPAYRAEFFFTNEIAAIRDPESGESLTPSN